MNPTDDFTTYYQDLLEGVYDCVDRIVVNAYYPPGSTPGGFRNWWRQLTGSDETLDEAHLQRMAGRFRRRLAAYAQKHRIPFIYCESADRKHKVAEAHLPASPDFKGLFLILIARAPAPVWEVQRYGRGGINLKRKEKWSYVNHYYFHLMDPEWGHVTVRMCGYPPFRAQVIANGHEWVERQARNQSLPVHKEGNCFTDGNDYQALNQIAKTLRVPHAIGQLTEACDRWLYSSCLCFALNLAEQERTGFRYQYSAYQLEYSRNLLFRRGRTMEEVYEKLLDRTRGPLDVRMLKTIFGRKHRPYKHPRARGSEVRLEKVIERPSYDLTVFKLHFGKLALKIYDKGDRVLRIEVVAHNVKDLRSGTSVQKLPVLLESMEQALVNFLNMVRAAHISFLDEGFFESLPVPSQRGNRRVAGVDLNKPRMRTAIAAILALSPKPSGFTVGDLASKVREISCLRAEKYGPRHAAYDLAKIRAKDLVARIPRSRRYLAKSEGISKLCAYVVLRDKVLKPMMAGAEHAKLSPAPNHPHQLDICYANLHRELLDTFKLLGLVA